MHAADDPLGIRKRVDPRAGEQLVIGRDESCDLTLADEKASRRHAQLTVGADGIPVLEDLASTNGTYVDGRRISAPVALESGRSFTIGDTVIELGVGAGARADDDSRAPSVSPAPRVPGPTPQTSWAPPAALRPPRPARR